MPKVMCIQELYNHPKNKREIPMPEVGNDYETAGEAYEDGLHLYKLVGFPDDCGYIQSAFATLPDASADEMAEEEQFIYEPFSC